MRGTVCKRLRKAIYGDSMSPKVREYRRNARTGAVENVGLRADYQRAKKGH